MGAKIYGYGRSEREDLGYLQGYYTKPRLQDFLKDLDYVINVMPSTNETKSLLNNGLLKNCSGNNIKKIYDKNYCNIINFSKTNGIHQHWQRKHYRRNRINRGFRKEMDKRGYTRCFCKRTLAAE